MRVCPVCSESFGDEFRFCELDGSRLQRQREEAAGSSNKGWSFLGLGLLVGAVVLSISIFFLPKRRVTPAAITSPSTPQQTSSESAATAQPDANNVIAEAPASTEAPALTAEQAAALEAKKKKSLAESELAPTSLDPKAAFKAEESTDPGASRQEPPVTASQSEPTAAVKPAADPNGSEAGSKPEKPATEPKVAPKQTGASSPSADKQDGKKKNGDEKDKKKGGFFRVFKKIFGKD